MKKIGKNTMKNLWSFPLLLPLFLQAPKAWALSIGSQTNFAVQLDYACLSADGVPISASSPLASRCCTGGPPPPDCRVGFNTIAPVASEESVKYLAIARQTLQNAAMLTGNEGDLSSANQATNIAGNPSSDAMVAGSVVPEQMSGSGNPGPSSLSPASGVSGAGGGGRGAGSGGGAGGSVAGATRGLGASGSKAAEFGGGGYLGGDAAKGRSGSGVDGVQVASTDVKELTYAGSAGSDVDGKAGMNADGSDSEGMSGSKEDATDYLTRIDKAASIFKVVSKRYEKELARNRIRIPPIK